MMNSKRTLVTSLALIAAGALLAGCAGSNKGGYYPEAPADYDESPAEAGGYGYGQPGAAPDAEEADFGPAPAQPAPSPAPAAQSKSADDDGGARAEREFTPGGDRDPFALSRKKNRPGLATQFGERRFSRVSTAPFVRADRLHPFAMGKLFYNDPQGIAAMTDTRGSFVDHTRRFSIGSGHVEMGLRDGSGRFLTGFKTGGDNFVTGIAGHRYTIVIKNHSPGRIEAVVSVDGLDVIDGKDGAFTKRGYLIDPHGDLEIDGFRTSNSEVAAFRFGSVESSYANKKHGKTRNVGVIGVALFHERGDSPGSGAPRPRMARWSSATTPTPSRTGSPPRPTDLRRSFLVVAEVTGSGTIDLRTRSAPRAPLRRRRMVRRRHFFVGANAPAARSSRLISKTCSRPEIATSEPVHPASNS